MRLFIVMFVTFLLFACATQKTVERPAFTLHSNKVLVIPTSSMQPGIENDSLAINDAIKRELVSQGFEIVPVDSQGFQEAHTSALEVTGSVYNPKLKQTLPYDRALYVRALINALKAHYYFDMLIDSEVVLRPAAMKANSVKWDGASKKMIINNQPKNAKLPTEAKGISLRLVAYTPMGGVVKQSFSGIALPYDIDYQHSVPKLVLKNDFFTDSDIKEAVKRALQPIYRNVEIIDGKK